MSSKQKSKTRRHSRRRLPGREVDAAPPSEAVLRILRAISRIPPGRVSTYGRIAALAGLPRRARLVGRVLAECPLAEGVPWHRVVNAAGRISLRSGGGPSEQHRRLAAEGVEIDSRCRIDLGIYLWAARGFQ